MRSKLLKAVSGILFNAVMGLILAVALGGIPALGAVAAVGGSMLLGGFMPTSSACAGLYSEIWTGELVQKLRAADTAPWLDGIPDYSALTDKNIIHLVDVGVDPAVLINNTTYPIPITAIDDADIPISLDKYQTEATPLQMMSCKVYHTTSAVLYKIGMLRLFWRLNTKRVFMHLLPEATLLKPPCLPPPEPMTETAAA